MIRSVDVRRQRDFAKSVENVQNILRGIKSDPAMTFLIRLQDSCVDVRHFADTATNADLCAHSRSFTRAQHHPPIVLRNLFQEQDLELSTGLGVDCAKPSWDDARII